MEVVKAFNFFDFALSDVQDSEVDKLIQATQLVNTRLIHYPNLLVVAWKDLKVTQIKQRHTRFQDIRTSCNPVKCRSGIISKEAS